MDPDAAAYITNVETADGQPLEEKVKIAIDNFVLGCKADGIWNAIKASCILAGARTLAGALVPLVGTAPTNVGPFVSGDYDRKTGLAGDGSTKYLNSNRASSADPQNSFHLSFFSTTKTSTGVYIGSIQGSDASRIYRFSGSAIFTGRQNLNGAIYSDSNRTTGFVGGQRATSSSVEVFASGQLITNSSSSSNAPSNQDHYVFCQNNAGTADLFTALATRLSFYSIGESLDLALLDARVTTLMSDLAAAIV
jgi:hypothetical protein